MYQNEYLVCGPPNFPKTNSDKSFTKIQFELIYVSQSLNVVTIFFFKGNQPRPLHFSETFALIICHILCSGSKASLGNGLP